MNFKELPIKEAMVLKQTLAAAHGAARCLAVMFPMHDNDMVPTAAQIALSEEILSDALNNFVIPDENIPFIHTTLSFMLDTFQTSVKYGTDDEMSGHEFIMRMYGIDFNEEFEAILKKYILLLNPNEIFDIVYVGNEANMDRLYKVVCNTAYKQDQALYKDSNADTTKFDVQLIIDNKKFILPSVASTFNGLIDFVEYIKSEV